MIILSIKVRCPHCAKEDKSAITVNGVNFPGGAPVYTFCIRCPNCEELYDIKVDASIDVECLRIETGRIAYTIRQTNCF